MKQIGTLSVMHLGVACIATTPVLAEKNGAGASRSSLIILAQAKTVSKDEAISKAAKIKRGNVLKATLEKRDNQVVWDVRIEDQSHSIASVQIDPHSGDVLKSLDKVEEDPTFHFDNSTFNGSRRQFVGE